MLVFVVHGSALNAEIAPGKRRKVRCQMSSDEQVTTCAECLSRGTICLSQELPQDYIPTGGIQLGDRMQQLESSMRHIAENLEYVNETMRKMESSQQKGQQYLAHLCESVPVLVQPSNVFLTHPTVVFEANENSLRIKISQ